MCVSMYLCSGQWYEGMMTGVRSIGTIIIMTTVVR